MSRRKWLFPAVSALVLVVASCGVKFDVPEGFALVKQSPEYTLAMSPEGLKAHREWRVERATQAFKKYPDNTLPMFEKVVQETLPKFHELMREKNSELILVRMPTSGEHWAHSQAVFPKELFWDKISEWSHIPTIHFYDFEELSVFECPDTSHLDASDAPEFTRRLIAVIKDTIMESEPSHVTLNQ